MPVQRFGETARRTTMVCAVCEVTWRGFANDECWSCGTCEKVGEAMPRKVRYSPTVVNAERLVG